MLLLALTLVLELSPQRWSSPGGSEALSLLLADLAVTAALLLAGWVLLCAAVGAAARLPGGLGRAARRLLAVLLPRTMRVLVLGAVGWQVVGPVPAAALDTAPAVERPRTSAPAFLTPAVETPRHDSSSVEAAPVEVVVAPGDSLWSIAQRHLRPGSSTAEVAAAWPGWYAANQRVIGRPRPAPGRRRAGRARADGSAGMTVSPRALRLVPVPRPAALPVQPTTATAAFQGTLALELVPPAAPPAMPAAPSWDTDDDEPPPTPDPRGLPEPRRWSAVLAQAVVEILAGRRPAAQVLRWVDPAVYERVRRSAEATAARGRGGGVPVRVRRVRVGTSPDGPVEAVVVLDDGARCRSLALRLEPLDGRWLCTALDVV